MPEEEKTKFREWAILELMGHRRLAGLVSEQLIASAPFIRIDVPGRDGKIATQFYQPAAVYCLTAVDEGLARRVAEQTQPEPVHRWELPEAREPEPPSADELGSEDGFETEDVEANR